MRIHHFKNSVFFLDGAAIRGTCKKYRIFKARSYRSLIVCDEGKSIEKLQQSNPIVGTESFLEKQRLQKKENDRGTVKEKWMEGAGSFCESEIA